MRLPCNSAQNHSLEWNDYNAVELSENKGKICQQHK